MWGGFRHHQPNRQGEDTTQCCCGDGGAGKVDDDGSNHQYPPPRTPSCPTGVRGAGMDKKGFGGGVSTVATASTVFSSPETTTTTTTTPHGRHRPAAEHASEECNGAAGVGNDGPGGSARKKLFHSPDLGDDGDGDTKIHGQSNGGHVNVVECEDEVSILRSRLVEKVEENRRLDRRVRTLTETVFALEEEVDRCNQGNNLGQQDERRRQQNRWHEGEGEGEGEGDEKPQPPPAEENDEGDEDGEDQTGEGGGGRGSPPPGSDASQSPSPSRSSRMSSSPRRGRRRRRRDEMHRRACQSLTAIVNDVLAKSGRRGRSAKTTANANAAIATSKSSPASEEEDVEVEVDVDVKDMMEDFSTLLESFAAENAITDDEEVYDGKSTVVDRADVGWFANELRWHFDEIVRVHKKAQNAASSSKSAPADGDGDEVGGGGKEVVGLALGEVVERFRSDRTWCDDLDDPSEEDNEDGEEADHPDGHGEGEVPRQLEEEPSSAGEEQVLLESAATAATAGGGDGPGDGDLLDLTACCVGASSSPLSSPLDPRIVNAIACASSSSTTLHPGLTHHDDHERELMRKQIVALANALRKSETERAELLERMVRSEREAGGGGG